jgi:hypothetical protein
MGYTPESVRLLLADRDKMFIRAAERARAAEALVLELRSELEALKAHFEERQALRPAETTAADVGPDRDVTRMELDRATAAIARSRPTWRLHARSWRTRRSSSGWPMRSSRGESF